MALPRSKLLPRADDVSDADLIVRARGDAQAFATLYRRHYPAIQRYVRRRIGGSGLVDDVVADTFVKALEYLPRYQERGLPFRAWLYRLATSRIARTARRARRRLEQLTGDLASERVDIDGADDDRWDRERLRCALLALPTRFQTVLALHYLEGLALEEVAAIAGCAVGTVKSRLARGRTALRQKLARHGGEA